MKTLAPATLLLTCGLLASCGGEGAAPTEQVTPTATVDWPARSRDFSAPSSALSFKMVLHSSNPAQPDVVIQGDRDASPALHAQVYSYAGKALVGPYTLAATFYSQPGQSGGVTATANANVALFSCGCLDNPDGSDLPTIAFNGLVSKVVMTQSQPVPVGNSTQLSATASDASGNILALTPGSFQFFLTSGGQSASLTSAGSLTGISGGTATVTASVDGVISSPLNVQIGP